MKMCKQRQRTAWGTGMNPTGHYPHMFEERGEKEFYPNDNRDPHKEEIKIPPPHPHKRKNINYFSHSKDPYFLYYFNFLLRINTQERERKREILGDLNTVSGTTIF
jgi:hypothetical protein